MDMLIFKITTNNFQKELMNMKKIKTIILEKGIWIM